MPNLAEVYFFSGLDNDFRIFNPTISLVTEKEMLEFVEEFDRAAPAVLIHDTESQYNAGQTPALLHNILGDYVLVDTIERFDVYQRRSG